MAITEGNGAAPERIVTDDLDALIATLPPHLAEKLEATNDRSELLEVVMDIGRLPEARYPNREIVLSHTDVTEDDLNHVISRVGEFGDDNRAGIERTLHRISAIRNRRGKVVGLTCRIGRAVYGTIRIIEDLVMSGKSILLLGRPGVGKTTMLREVARVLADEANKRVVIVDTSNEIGGDGDIPHPAIGGARRMQVSTPALQHGVMIEAVENHMPEVIVIDEIGTELEASAARTIAERGVQLVGTAHGNTLENLMVNPTLCDLIGGIQSVTLSDEEARRRGTQKSILERMAPPTFDAVIEIQGWRRVAMHEDVGATVDAKLRGFAAPPEVRELTDEGTISTVVPENSGTATLTTKDQSARETGESSSEQETRLFPFGISRSRLVQAIKETGVPVEVVDDLHHADALITLRHSYRKKPAPVREAEERSLPIYVIKSNTLFQMEQVLLQFRGHRVRRDPVAEAYRETEEAISRVLTNGRALELAPANSYIRRVQHELAGRFNLESESYGSEPERRVRILPEPPRSGGR
ncbi:MAG: hypothetical protein CL897_05205 [Dehalococcoidia bacterium]|mgnify:CR=1 FL=1|nr:hypothetical protein [Dehalococcoidia bacterium]|tara:strand:- start:6457 stop:8034 length:1578 start_codon:yes stop_codon:yes gene_type:complete